MAPPNDPAVLGGCIPVNDEHNSWLALMVKTMV